MCAAAKEKIAYVCAFIMFINILNFFFFCRVIFQISPSTISFNCTVIFSFLSLLPLHARNHLIMCQLDPKHVANEQKKS